MTPKVLGALDVAVHVAKAAGAARVAELVKASDFDDEQRIVFSLRGVIVGKDEHGEPVTAPVVVPPRRHLRTEGKRQRRLPTSASR